MVAVDREGGREAGRVWKLKVTAKRSNGWSLLLRAPTRPPGPFPVVSQRDKRERQKTITDDWLATIKTTARTNPSLPFLVLLGSGYSRSRIATVGPELPLSRFS